MRKSEKYLALTNCEATANMCDEVIDTKKLLANARTENRIIAVKCAIELNKAIENKTITNRKGGEVYVHHFLQMFKNIPIKEGVLFDKVTFKTLSIRESEWIACKTILSMPFGASRTILTIESKRKNGKGGFDVIPFSEIDFNNDYEVECAKLKITIKPLRGCDTNASLSYSESKTENKNN